MQKQLTQLDPAHIISAFSIILNPSPSPNNKALIHQADTYIHSCQGNPEFARTLIHIFSQVPSQAQKWQILIHLNNVIRRNWTVKRRGHQGGMGMSEDMKEMVKNQLMELYKANWENYYKEFNQIFKFLAKHEFPTNYEALKNFMLQILGSLANSDIEALIAPKQLLPYLSLVKTVFKQNSRRYCQKRQTQLQYIAEPLKLSFQIFLKINHALQMIKNLPSQNLNQSASIRLLECSRKIDKIILYCLQSMGTGIQGQGKVREIVYALVGKLEMLVGIRGEGLGEQVQKDLWAILEGLNRLMTLVPFVFTGFLEKYLRVILRFLISQNFQNPSLRNCIITSNTRPLTTVSYYLSQPQFRQSLQFRKGSKSAFLAEQIQCHQDYLIIYSGSNAISFMERAIMELMGKYYVNVKGDEEKDIIFEDSEQQDGSVEYTSYELLLGLLKNLMTRFRDEFKPFMLKILDHLIENNMPATASHIALHMYEIILLMPRVYDELNLNTDKIYNLIEICYSHHDFSTMSRLIRHYNSYFSETQIHKSFQLLIDVITTARTDIDHHIWYQCAVCIKKILSEHGQQNLPVEKLGPCLTNLLKLISLYKGVPMHLWNLLQLMNEMMKIVSSDVLVQNLGGCLEGLDGLVMEENSQTVITAISDLLQNLFEILTNENAKDSMLLRNLHHISLNLLSQNPVMLYKLWISIVRTVNSGKCEAQFAEKLVNALQAMRGKIIEKDPAIFLQLTQQYFLSGLINLSPENILELSQQIGNTLTQQTRTKTLICLFSLYFTHFLLTSAPIPHLLQTAVQELVRLENKLSQQINTYRTFLMLVVNHHIVELGPEVTYKLINEGFGGQYRGWWYGYLWSLEYMNYKYACKVAAIALLASLDMLDSAGILGQESEGIFPLQKIAKAASFQLQPISIPNATTSYINSFRMIFQPSQSVSRVRLSRGQSTIPRKYKLHVRADWAECDLTAHFREKMGNLFARAGWNAEVVGQRFDSMAAARILGILGGEAEGNQREPNGNGNGRV